MLLNLLKLKFKILTQCFLKSFLWMSVFFIHSTRADFDLEEIKSLSSPLEKEFQFLSPVEGIIWASLVPNIYDFGSDGSAESVLVHQLFNRLSPNHFGVSHLHYKVAPYLTHYILGKIKGLLHTKEVSDFNFNKHGKKKLDLLVEKMVEKIWQEESLTNLRKEKEQEALKLWQEYQQALLKSEEDGYEKKLTQLIEMLKQYLLIEGNRPDKDRSEGIKKINQTYDLEMKKNFKRLIRLLIEKKENKNLFKIMDAFLWMTSTSKNDYGDYYQGVQSAFEKDILSWKAENLTFNQEKEIWLNEQFSKEEIRSIYTDPVKKSFDFKDQTDEELIYKINRASTSHTPLILYGRPNVNGLETYSDCGETSIRNFFKILLHSGASTYNIKILQDIHEKTKNVSPQLMEFFRKYNKTDQQTTHEARSDWDRMLSQLDRVQYLKVIDGQNCELNAGSDNVLKVLNLLLGRDLTQLEPMNWKEFFTFINSFLPKKLTLEGVYLTERNLGNIIFQSFYEGSFQWHFDHNHFIIEAIPNRKLNNELEEFNQRLLYPTKNDSLNIPLETVALTPSSDKKIEQLKNKLVETNNFLLLFYNEYKNENDFLQLHSAFLSLNKLSKTLQFPYTPKMSKNLYAKLNQNLNKIQFLEILNDELAVHFVKEVEDLLKIKNLEWEIAKALLSKPIWKNYPHLVEELIKKKSPAAWPIAEYVLSQPHWANYPHLISLYDTIYGHTENLIKHVFSQEHWKYSSLDRVKKLVDLEDEGDAGKEGKWDPLLIEHVLAKDFWKDEKDLVLKILNRGKADAEIVRHILNQPDVLEKLDLVEKILQKGTQDKLLIQQVFSRKEWFLKKEGDSTTSLIKEKYLPWVRLFIQKKTLNKEIVQYIFSQPGWANDAESTEIKEMMEEVLDQKDALREFAKYVFSQDYIKIPPLWIEKLIDQAENNGDIHEILSHVLTKPLWKNHPQFILRILQKISHDYFLDTFLTTSHWRINPSLKLLTQGKIVTAHHLREGIKKMEQNKSQFMQENFELLCQQKTFAKTLGLSEGFSMQELQEIFMIK